MKLDHNRKQSGFTFVDLVLTILAVGSMMLVFCYAARPRGCVAQRVSCTNNLKQVGLAYRQWALDNGDKFPMSVSITNGGVMEIIEEGNVWATFSVMSNELNTPKIVFCPQDNDRRRGMATTFGAFFSNTNVSYLVGLDADETLPETILSGDDNFAVVDAKPTAGILRLWTNSPVAWSKDRHVQQGNVGLADGSVLGPSTPKLREMLAHTGMATNRFVFP